MFGNTVRIGVMGALALVGSMQIASVVPNCLANDPRVVSMKAQWKMATGDAEGAYKVLRRAEIQRQTAPVSHAAQASQSRPVSTRG